MTQRAAPVRPALRRQHPRSLLLLSWLPLWGLQACSEAGRTAWQGGPEVAAGASGLAGSPGGEAGTGAGSGGTGPGGVDPLAGGGAVEAVPGVSCGDVVCSAFSSCGSSDGSSACQCAPGLAGDGLRCLDIDECGTAADLCGAHGRCQNGFGNYSCSCDAGYSWNGTGCVDVNECEHDPCDAAALCQDTDGGFRCTCAEGSFGDGFFCSTTDACADDPCGADGECLNVPDAGGGSGYLCQCHPGFQGNSACSPCGENLVLADPALRTALNRQLGRALEDASPIPLRALAEVSALDASGLGVTDLTGLACWPALERLQLSHNPGFVLDDNERELSRLQRLVELRLDCTGSTRLNAVADHPALRSLSVNVVGCEAPTLLEDASAVRQLPGLEYLDLRGHAQGSVSFLSGAKNLRSLWLGHNRLRSVDEIGNLPLLRELELGSNGLESLDGLTGLAQLQALHVPSNQLQQLEPTLSLSQLQVINASDNALTSLPDWKNLQQLREVTVSANQLTQIATLAALPRLNWLNLAQNEVNSLSPLVEGALQGTLVVTGNPLPCAVEAAHITALRARGVDVKGSCEPQR